MRSSNKAPLFDLMKTQNLVLSDTTVEILKERGIYAFDGLNFTISLLLPSKFNALLITTITGLFSIVSLNKDKPQLRRRKVNKILKWLKKNNYIEDYTENPFPELMGFQFIDIKDGREILVYWVKVVDFYFKIYYNIFRIRIGGMYD